MEKCVYEGADQVNDLAARVIRFIEKICRMKLGFRQTIVTSGRILNKEIRLKPNTDAFNGGGGSGNYQWLEVPTLTVDAGGIICEVIIPRDFYNQLTTRDKLKRVESQVSLSGNRVRAWIIP